MSHYLLSVMEPAGPMPAPEVLEPIMQAVGVVDEAMRDAGIWVYAGGLHDPSTATVLRAKDGEVVTTDGPVRRGAGAPGRVHHHRRRRP